MDQISLVTHLGCSVSLLTATCPPSMTRALREHVGLTHWQEIRAPSTRSNIIYEVRPMKVSRLHPLEKEVWSYIQGELQPHLSLTSAQVVIFVNTHQTGEDLKSLSGCPFYHGKLDSQTRDALLLEFRQGTFQVLIATKAFGAGIDISTIDAIVHAGSPWDFANFAQESGRCGRGSKIGLSVIFPTNTNSRVIEQPDILGHDAFNRWLRDDQKCRRAAMAEVLDGCAVECSVLPDAQFCDVCSRELDTPSGLERMVEQLRSSPKKDAPDRDHAFDDQDPSSSGTNANSANIINWAPPDSQSLFADLIKKDGTTTLPTRDVFSTPMQWPSQGSSTDKSKDFWGSNKRYREQSEEDFMPKRMKDMASPTRSCLKQSFDATTPSSMLADIPSQKITQATRLADLMALHENKLKYACFPCIFMGKYDRHSKGDCSSLHKARSLLGLKDAPMDVVLAAVRKLGGDMLRGGGYSLRNVFCGKCLLPRSWEDVEFHESSDDPRVRCRYSPSLMVVVFGMCTVYWIRGSSKPFRECTGQKLPWMKQLYVMSEGGVDYTLEGLRGYLLDSNNARSNVLLMFQLLASMLNEWK
jgi:hypothetical protein